MERSVLVIKLGAFGDLMMADGAMHDIRLAYPRHKLVLLTRHGFAKLYRPHPHIDLVLADQGLPRWRLDYLIKLKLALEQHRFEFGFDLQNSRRSLFYRRWLLSNVPFSGLPSDRSRNHPNGLIRSVQEEHAELLRSASVSSRHTLKPVPTWICKPMDHWLNTHAIEPPFVVLLAGASSRHPEKKWPHFKALASALQAQGMSVVSIPGPDEKSDADLPGVTLRRPDGQVLDIHELAGILSMAAIAVGNDSGPLHLAAMLGTPCVALFGGNNAEWQIKRTGIIDQPHALALSAKEMVLIDVETVKEAVIGTLNKSLKS